MNAANKITFILNREQIEVELIAERFLLDYLRTEQRLTSVKESCREGECGACMVLLGELINGEINYKPVVSCLALLSEMQGKHLVTVEGLADSKLNKVQAILSEYGGSQCGYCTPGFVMALSAALMCKKVTLNATGVNKAISGNLCRCTGYRPIKDAGNYLFSLMADMGPEPSRLYTLCEQFGFPNYLLNIPDRLQQIPPTESKQPINKKATLVSGGTDVFVGHQAEFGQHPGAHIKLKPTHFTVQQQDGWLLINPLMSFDSFFHDPLIRQHFAKIGEMEQRIASWPIRIQATLGGNICQASPSADLACFLLAGKAEIAFADNPDKCWMTLQSFYLTNNRSNSTSKQPLSAMRIPVPAIGTQVHFLKSSHRHHLDIATVNSTLWIKHQQGMILNAHLAMGSVAAFPLYLRKTSLLLSNKKIVVQTVLEAARCANQEIQPKSDIRGSVRYRRLLVRQMLLKHFVELFPDYINERAVYASLRE